MHADPNIEVTISERGHKNRWLSMLFISVSLLVISLDNTVLNVALPSISTDLGAGQSDLQWIVDAYILVFAALLLTMGAFGDRIGRKRALQTGLVLFGIGSLAAAMSDTTGMLIAARGFLGVGAAFIMPATLSIVTATFRDKKERSQAIALWAATFGLGIGIGPVVGGWLIERFDWNTVFFVNLPVMAVALIGGYIFIEESRDENAPRIDIPGVLLSITGLFALVYGIIEAGLHGWTDQNVLLAFGAAVVLLGAFAFWEASYKHAMLPIRFFRNMSFTGANTALALTMFGMFGAMFTLPQFFQSVQGLSPLESGLRIVPMAIVLVIVAGASAKIAERLKLKLTVALGFILAAGGMFFMSQTIQVDTEYSTILIGLAIMAGGLGLAMPPATDSIMGSVPVSKAGIGSAMNDTTRELGGALGVAILGTVLNDNYLSEIGAISALPQAELIPPEAMGAIESSIQGALAVTSNPLMPAEMGTAIQDIASTAFTNGMTEAMLIASIVLLLASVFVFVALPAVIQPPIEEDETEKAKNTSAIDGVVPSPAGD